MKTPAAAIFVILAGLLLAGCYMSEAMLLNSAEAVHPVATGRQTTTSDGRTQQIEIEIDVAGWYVMEEVGDDKPSRVLFTPLTTIGQRTIMAFVTQQDGVYIYGLAERRGAQILLDLPTCGPGPARDVAMAHNAKAPAADTIGAACTFEYPDDIRGALIDYARHPDIMREYATLPAGPE